MRTGEGTNDLGRDVSWTMYPMSYCTDVMLSYRKLYDLQCHDLLKLWAN